MTPTTFVIFGATGDLTHRKLLPALFSLFKAGNLEEQFSILGIGRRPYTDKTFTEELKKAVTDTHNSLGSGKKSWTEFASHIHYIQGLFEDDALYTTLIDQLTAQDKQWGTCALRLYYLATPPVQYELILTKLRNHHVAQECDKNIERNSRILIEKPFGRDLSTARRLDELLGTFFTENQIYRIDHYLAKETVQNILAFRFANGMFEPTWNSEFIDHIQITVSETLGMEGRGGSYDGVGALRDVVQNHMMQLLSVVAMEQPLSFNAESVRTSRRSVIASLKPLTKEEIITQTVRGQYVRGSVEGQVFPGFKEETGVDPKSITETFVALKVFVNSKRFTGVPFYLRTGKRLKQKATEISIHYKKPALCNGDVCFFDPRNVRRNVLVIRVEPDEAISLRLMVKEPGLSMSLSPVHMNFSYNQTFKGLATRDAYEKLLLDAIAGDQMLFAETQEIDASWTFINPILKAWGEGIVPLSPYQPGTAGPGRALSLLEKDDRYWY
jgi:glucose-6-phosphate 1-dehydrogenase